MQGSTIGPGLSIKVHLSLTIFFTVLYGLVFFLIITQLLQILYYKHRRLSYQTFFLFTCLIWAGLRTTLFSFYFEDFIQSNTLSPLFEWLLFALPIYLQYNMLSILVFYFLLVVVKVMSPSKLVLLRKRIVFGVVLSNIVFLATNISCSVVYSYNPYARYQQKITLLRVSVDYCIFLFAALVLCYCIMKLTRQSSARMLLEGQGVSFCQAISVCIIIALLYMSRAVFNILAILPVSSSIPDFNYGWINVSDQGEVGYDGSVLHNTSSYAFMSFGVVLIFWELLPTFVTVWFFRVRKPDGVAPPSATISESYHHAKSYFFDNPNRYDSDDDLSIAYTPPRSGIPGSLPDIPNFGSSSHLVRNANDKVLARKVIHSYGSVPAYDNYTVSRENPSSPSVHSPMNPMVDSKNFPGSKLKNSVKSFGNISQNASSLEHMRNVVED
ncbi:G protein-coupled receptor 137Ba isoform X2 [Hydra vulgaris]|uniref:G protein-coupled receptor 137Ba isoform X2 n=1 Tax=Hydra vulgaris TaxID=6087 RepID=A0ABM4CGP3_HYDVU